MGGHRRTQRGIRGQMLHPRRAMQGPSLSPARGRLRQSSRSLAEIGRAQ
ncbi:MAG: hypothetical protein ACREXW_15410 [Gammaproteobacteria bacterium]